jgi:hypothetical protein
MLATIKFRICLPVLKVKTLILKYTNYDFTFCFVWMWKWSLTLREGYRLIAFENWVLRRIYRPNGEEVTGEQRESNCKATRALAAKLLL